MSKLIVIRGPSAAGKSTTANYLHNFSTDNTVLLPKDVFAIDIIKDNHHLYKPMYYALENVAKEFLQANCTVILEGAMYRKHWLDMIERLSAIAEQSHIFFLRADLDTVINRSRQRKKVRVLAEEKVAELHPGAQPTNWENETIVDTNLMQSVDVVKLIGEQCGLTFDLTQEKATYFSDSFHPDFTQLQS